MSDKILKEFVIVQHVRDSHGKKCSPWESKKHNIVRYADDRDLTVDNIGPLFNETARTNPGLGVENVYVWSNHIEILKTSPLAGFKTVRRTEEPRRGY